MRRRRLDEPGDQEIVELAALADGSLSPQQRTALEARVAASPELADLLAEQERAVTLAQTAAAEVEAPAGLRARVDAQRRARRAPRTRDLAIAGGTAIAGLAAVVIIAVGVLGANSSGTRFHSALAATSLVPGAGGNATLT